MIKARRSRLGFAGLLALMLALPACDSRAAQTRATPASTEIARVPRRGLPTNDVTVAVSTGCPQAIGDAKDVANKAAGLARSLLPPGTTPSAALVCEFGETKTDGDLTVRLRHSVVLNRAGAKRLANAVQRLSLSPPAREQPCPADFFGAITIIAFAYRVDMTVDLWYHTAGCRTIDNGVVIASEIGHPAFYGAFESLFDSLAPTPQDSPGE